MKKHPLLWPVSKERKEELRNKEFQSGNALENHIRSVHQGTEDVNCPACQELRRKKNGNETEKVD